MSKGSKMKALYFLVSLSLILSFGCSSNKDESPGQSKKEQLVSPLKWNAPPAKSAHVTCLSINVIIIDSDSSGDVFYNQGRTSWNDAKTGQMIVTNFPCLIRYKHE